VAQLNFIIRFRDGKGRFVKPTQLSKAKTVSFSLNGKQIVFAAFKKKTVADKKKELAALTRKITAKTKPKAKPKAETKYKTRTISKNVFSSAHTLDNGNEVDNRNLALTIKIYRHAPIQFTMDTIKEVLLQLRPQHYTWLHDRFKDLPHSKRRFIIRVLYTVNTSKRTSERGFGTKRFHPKNIEDLKTALKSLRLLMRKKFIGTDKKRGYFAQWLPENELHITGFTIENIESMSRELRGSVLTRRRNQWERIYSQANQRRQKTLARNARMNRRRRSS